MASDRTVEDSSSTKESLLNYFIDHNLSIASQCVRAILALFEHAEARATDTAGDPVVIIHEILSLLADLNHSIDRQHVDTIQCVTDEADRRGVDTEFRRALVDLMVLTVQCWEQTSGKDKIDLAEKSRLWKVSNDNSQLRVRTMERYLSVKKLPKAPRWQTVLDTAYFVLNHSDRNLPLTEQLAKAVDNTVAILRSRARL